MSAFPCTCDSCEMGISDHLLDRLDTRDSLLGVRKTKRNRANQLAVNVNRASAHSLHHASALQRSAGEPGQNDGLLWSDILEYAEDFDLELFDAVTLEDGPADSMHSGANVSKREKSSGSGVEKRREKKAQQDREESHLAGKYFSPRTGGGLTHVSHCLSELVRTSLCD